MPGRSLYLKVTKPSLGDFYYLRSALGFERLLNYSLLSLCIFFKLFALKSLRSNIGLGYSENRQLSLASPKLLTTVALARELGPYLLYPLILSLGVVYLKLSLDLLPVAKVFFAWVSLFFFVYLVISGFVFFLKRYSFGRFTTAVSRFWKRSFSLFWLIEAYTFGCFVYLTLNSSSEVLYFYDYAALQKTHLFSFRFFFFKLLAVSLLISLTFFMVSSLSFLSESSVAFLGMAVSAVLAYIVWAEFLQFFHFVSFCEFSN